MLQPLTIPVVYEPFPDKLSRNCYCQTTAVHHDGEISIVKTVHCESGSVYELGGTIKQLLFGVVVRSVALEQINSEEYTRTNIKVAAKIYEKSKFAALKGKVEENPLRTISAVQYIGNSHEGIVGQIECCEDKTHIFVFTPYYAGELADYVDDNGPLPENIAKRMFKQVINGLEYLHSIGVGHCNMSLANIAHNADMQLFAIKNFHKSLKQTVAITPGRSNTISMPIYPFCSRSRYVAPEIMLGDRIFNPMLTDIWAVGVILFIALTGQAPMSIAVATNER